jgi:hypothetical protein
MNAETVILVAIAVAVAVVNVATMRRLWASWLFERS